MMITDRIRRVKSSEFLQSLAWAHQGIFRYDENNEMLLERFEEIYQDYDVDPEAEPINILCFDGGAMRGYALSVILSVIEEKYGKNGEINILEHFDLIAGASIGGALAISCNAMKKIHPAIVEMVGVTDEWREKVKGSLHVTKLLKTGSLVPEKYQIEAILKERWGESKPLLNPHGPPAIALCAMKYDDSCGEEKTGAEYEPFVVRTYEYPSTNSKETPNGKRDHVKLCDSTSSIKMYEAVAATTSVPGLASRVKIQVDEKKMVLSDGAQFAMCPITVALDEARRLYPQRPLGVILSIGMDDKDRTIVERAINTAKISSPKLHFQRIAPHTNFPLFEMEWEKIMLMEERVREYLLNDERTSTDLDETMKKILSKCPHTTSKYAVEDGSLEDSLHKMSLKSASYARRLSSSKSWVSHLDTTFSREQLTRDIERNLNEHGEKYYDSFGSEVIDKAKNLNPGPTEDKKESTRQRGQESANTHGEFMLPNESDIIECPGNATTNCQSSTSLLVGSFRTSMADQCIEEPKYNLDVEDGILLEHSFRQMILNSESDASTTSQSAPKENKTQQEHDPEIGNNEHDDDISPPSQPTLRDLYIFAIPCLCLVVCNPLLSIIDTVSVGITSKPDMGTIELGALGVGTTFIEGTIFLFQFLNVATLSLCANALGRQCYTNDEHERKLAIDAVVRMAVKVSLACGLGITGLVLWKGGYAVSLYAGGASKSTFDLATKYVMIRAISLPSSLMIGTVQSALLGVKDSKTPLIGVLVSVLVNVLGDGIVVIGFKLGVVGAAYATLAAQWTGAIAVCIPARSKLLVRSSSITHNERSMHKVSVMTFLAFAAPVMIVVLGQMVPYIMMTYVASSLPEEAALASHQIINSLFFFVSFFSFVATQTAQAFLPQYDAVDSTAFKVEAQVLSRRLLELTVLAATMVSSTVACIPYFLPFIVTNDTIVQTTIKPMALPLLLSSLLTAPMAVSEGILLARSDLKYLVIVYISSTIAISITLFKMKEMEVSILTQWYVFVLFQLFRAIMPTGRVWGGHIVRKITQVMRISVNSKRNK